MGDASEGEVIKLAAIFIVSYLAFSVPALIAGAAATNFGLHSTALVYAASLAALAAAAAGILFVPPQRSAHPASPSLASRHATGPVHCSAVPAGYGPSGR